MLWRGLFWGAGGYLAGTLPSTWLVARAKRAYGLISVARRSAGETDAHVLMTRHLGVGWTALAATLDVLKGFFMVIAARHWGRLDDAWVALTGVAVVVGHAYPFYAQQMAGRGLAAASGVYLALLPIEMVVAGLLIVIGGAIRATSLFTTVGMASVPVVAALTGQPGEFVAMATAVFAILMIRRMEGIGSVIRSGISPARAVLYRCVFDSSSAPAGAHWFRSGEEDSRP
jgi:acyl phosphate:glycerol-3-phosphate acyltransferase